ncbi:hypothetical protein HZH68_015192 [Vespula germanica]|uniref:Uncharacterized protein n=1 Tax=Vespula germanica TaxID=30212 RepID=A0A834MUC9_VESGE|nr:hypothetical protein HZH68_015192 [Vespula germanica]
MTHKTFLYRVRVSWITDSPSANPEIDGDADLIEISNSSEHTSRFHRAHRKVSKKQYRACASKKIRHNTLHLRII